MVVDASNSRLCVHRLMSLVCLFFTHESANSETYTLSLHDALPICARFLSRRDDARPGGSAVGGADRRTEIGRSTRLNSSHVSISYAVFCLKKKSRWTYGARLPSPVCTQASVTSRIDSAASTWLRRS